MSIGVKTPAVHHITIRTADLARSRRFYIDTLGFPLAMELSNLFLFFAGKTAVGVRGPEGATPPGDRFSPFRVGLDHIALGCEDEAELERVAKGLAEAGVDNTGLKFDEILKKRYIAFKDPDRIAWEYYMV